MGNASRHRWIIRNFIATLSRRTLPLRAKNPLLRHPGQLATELAQLFVTGSSVAQKGLRGSLAQLASPSSQDIGPNSELSSDLAHCHAGRVEHGHGLTLVLR